MDVKTLTSLIQLDSVRFSDAPESSNEQLGVNTSSRTKGHIIQTSQIEENSNLHEPLFGSVPRDI